MLTECVCHYLIACISCLCLTHVGVKLTPRINPETHAMMIKATQAHIKVPPFNQLGWSAETLRVVIGLIEVWFGALALCPHYTRLSAFVLSCVMCGAIWTHLQLHEPFLVPAGLLAVTSLLFLLSGDSVSKKPSVSAAKKGQ